VTPPPPGARAVTAGGSPCLVYSRPFVDARGGGRVLVRHWCGDHWGPPRAVGADKVYREEPPMGTKYPDLFKALAGPFAEDEVKTLPKGRQQLRYVTARTVANRLDEVLGPENWWDSYPFIAEASAICLLTLRLPDGSTVTKCDAGGAAGMADAGDDDKSIISDAFKRAAAKWGVGRYLYRDGVPDYGEPEARSLPKEPDEPEPDAADAARLREKRKAQRDIARPYGEFATDAVKEARDVFYAKCIRNTVAVPSEEVKELPNVHQLGWHLTKWLAEKGWAEAPPEGTQTSDNNRALAEGWRGSTPKVRATIRMEARRYLAEKFGKVYERLAGHGGAYEPPAEAEATATVG
jgi:hypothetical protein